MAGARMQDIADTAGINKAMLHYYFRSKQKLFDKIMSDAVANFFPRVVGILNGDLPLAEKIQCFAAEYVDMLLENPYLPLFVLNEASLHPARFAKRWWKDRESPFTEFARQVESEVAARNIKPVHPLQLVINMLSLCIFPFISRPIWTQTTGIDEEGFRAFMLLRKTEIPRFIMDAIKN
jgi:AcrR family transcriptional regulator